MEKCNRVKVAFLFIGLILIFSSPAFAGGRHDINLAQAAGDKTGSGDKDKKKQEAASRLFVYKPPMRGKPGNRVGGGTRGLEHDVPVIAALVPDHTGLTTRGQPVLYWYLSKPTKYDVEFTLNDEHGLEPLVEVVLKNGDIKGIHGIRLSEYNMTLLRGVEYQWFVTVVRDPEQRSRDIIATGTIRRVEPTKTLQEELARAGKTELPYIYAGQGIWYDALSEISELISDNPNDAGLVEQRASFLNQSGLSEVVGN